MTLLSRIVREFAFGDKIYKKNIIENLSTERELLLIGEDPEIVEILGHCA